MFLYMAGKGFKNKDYLMSPEGDSDWEEQMDWERETDPEYAKEDETQVRREWAELQQENGINEGDPSMHFDTARLLPAGTWLVHFTDAKPSEIIKEGFKGRDLYILGLTTTWKSDSHPGDYALAYKVGDVRGHGREFGKYGKNAVLFQVKEAALAYHYGDEENQAVFITRDAYNLWPIYGDFDSLTLCDPKTLDEIYTGDRNNQCIEEMVSRIESGETQPMAEDATASAGATEAKTKQEIKEEYATTTSYLSWPVELGGDPDHHITCKFFSTLPVTVEQIEACLKGIDKSPPRSFGWTPIEFDTQKNGTVRVLELNHFPKHMADCHYALESLRKDDYPEYRPHITVSDELWERVKKEKLLPGDLRIKVGPLTFASKGKLQSVIAKVVSPESKLPKDSELLEFYYMADRDQNNEQWIEDAKEQFESMDDETIDEEIEMWFDECNWDYEEYQEEMAKLAPEDQKKKRLEHFTTQYIHSREENEDSSLVYFEKPRIIGRTVLYRFTPADPAEILKSGFSGHGPKRLGLTFHESPGMGDLAFAFEKKDLKKIKEVESLASKYGPNLFQFSVPYAVKVYHNTDYEDQVVFDVTTVKNLKFIGKIKSKASAQELDTCLEPDDNSLAFASKEICDKVDPVWKSNPSRLNKSAQHSIIDKDAGETYPTEPARVQSAAVLAMPLNITPKMGRWIWNTGAAGTYTIDPKSFIRLTSQDEHEFQEILKSAKSLDFYNSPEVQADMKMHPFLEIYQSNGRIRKHEGRHRAAALIHNNETKYEIAIILVDDKGRVLEGAPVSDIPTEWTCQYDSSKKYSVDASKLNAVKERAEAAAKKELNLPDHVMPSPLDDYTLDDARRTQILQFEGKGRGCVTFQDFQELLSQILLELQLTEDYRKSVAGILNKMRHGLGLELL